MLSSPRHDDRRRDNIRNFAIIAHIDHGKSTLADRLIQMTGGLTAREMKEQVLDSMDIERERGITIKAQTVRLNYRARDGKDYVLNLIDTPGHVDFAYEVNRSLAACEGSLLVVDASQGVEAQTLANVYQAHRQQPRDRPGPQQDRPAGGRAGAGQAADRGRDRPRRLERDPRSPPRPGRASPRCSRRSSPACRRRRGDPTAPLKALLVDSWYDAYLGVVVLVRIVDGVLKKGMKIRMMGTGAAHEVDKVGVFTPKLLDWPSSGPGEIGFLTGSIKEVADTRVGDTITEDRRPAERAAARLPAGAAGGLLRHLPGRRRRLREPARRDRQAPPQRRRLHLRDGDLAPRSASASAAASSACSTSRSCRSG